VEVRVDLPVPAYLPEDYVPAVDERVRFYRRLASALTPEALARVREELVGTYGPPPLPAAGMLATAHVRTAAATLGASSVTVVRNRLQVSGLDLTSTQAGKLARLGGIYVEHDRRLAVPIQPGFAPDEAAVQLLDAILDAAETPHLGDSE
jgi:transcription-repair coupling factor (superfamily II helicase)